MSHTLQCCDHIVSTSNDIISQRKTRRRSGHIFIQNNPNDDSVQEVVLRNGMAENMLMLFYHTPDMIVVLFCIIALGVLSITVDFGSTPEFTMEDEIFTKFELARQRFQEMVEA